MKNMNIRKQLTDAASWLGEQSSELEAGLSTSLDAVMLWAYRVAHPGLPKAADKWKRQHFIDAIGYDPFKQANVWTPVK